MRQRLVAAMSGVSPSGVSPSAIYFNCPDPRSVSHNFFNLSQYACFPNFFGDDRPRTLTPAVGYLVVIAFGLAFGLFTVALIYLEHYILGSSRRGNSEYVLFCLDLLL